MSKTIEEIRAAKSALEKQIASLLSNFESENDVEISNCYCGHYSTSDLQDENATVYSLPTTRQLTVEISISI